MGRVQDKVTVITGAASGMGLASAELFAKEGAIVVLTDLNDAAGEAAAQRIRDAGGRAVYKRMDVCDETSIRTVMEETASANGDRIDILVNCAGIIGADKRTHECSEAEWDALFAVDVKGVFFCSKHAIPYMMKHKAGSIVNFSSIYGLFGNHEYTPYHIAKGAVTMQTRQDAAVYGEYNIRVNSVHPSTVRTALVEGICETFPGGIEAYEKLNTTNQSLKRLGLPREVAYAVLYLASDEASWVTGVNLPVDGGFTAR